MLQRATFVILSCVCVWVVSATTGNGATITFEDLGLSPNSYYSGHPGGSPPDGNYGGPFVSGGVTFPNQYVISGGFNYYNGWAASNRVTASPTVGTYGVNYDDQWQFSVPTAGTGAYAVTYINGFSDAPLVLPAGTTPSSISINNTNYGLLSMRDGDSFTTKLGGIDGLAEDYFQLVISGLNNSNQPVGTPVTAYLGNYLGSNTLIVNSWQTLDLSPLAGASKLAFSFNTNNFGIPTTFAMDNLVVIPVPEPSTWLVGAGLLVAACCLRRRRSV
jgi:hypothetical protein